MRIGIREQLALLVLFTSMIALAVVSIATVRLPNRALTFESMLIYRAKWVNNFSFVVNIR